MTLTLAAPTRAQQHAHPDAERLGTVHFPTSCAESVAPQFDRAVALLHSFEFGASIRGFESVLARDSACAMAWWGIALSRWTNPMVPNLRPTAVLERGNAAAQTATRLASRRGTPRERGYIAAVNALFTDPANRDQRARVLRYEQAMADVASANPTDTEARIFHAIAIVGSALPTDKSYANQLRAGAMLESLFVKQPDHPGLAHYIIHAYDIPALAGRAAVAAKRYADIAPSAAHALHMPSHTFTRVGMWNESVATNLRSRDEATRVASIAEALHASDYAVYANLQMRRDSAARRLLVALPDLIARFDPTAVTGAAPPSAGFFAIAAIPARYALERRAWSEAAALELRPSDVPYADAITHFARAIGAARLGDTMTVARSALSLDTLRSRLSAMGEVYWAEQVAIQSLAAQSLLAEAAGRREFALQTMREAARREDATEKAAVTPGPIAPARELLADMLAARGQHREALIEYRAALAREPNRYWSLHGAAQSAAAAGDRAAEASYRKQLDALTRTGAGG